MALPVTLLSAAGIAGHQPPCKSSGGSYYSIIRASGAAIDAYNTDPDLLTAWDVSTASYNGIGEEFSVASEEPIPQALFFKPDGLRMFVLGNGGNSIVEYDLSIARDTANNPAAISVLEILN